MLPLIPYPSQVKLKSGYCKVPKTVLIDSGCSSENLKDYLTENLKRICSVKTCFTDDDSAHIKLCIDASLAGDNTYKLRVDTKNILVLASVEESLFHGIQTLLQLIRFAPYKNGNFHIQSVEIEDKPAFGWRGMHLDVSRHFFSVATIKKHLDLLAFYKMNIFHWHLTDDQGWRIEIKKYPKLTKIGSLRKTNSDKPYGGFYSQAEIREIVEYASKKHITVVPEIDMPGHSTAALASYPELSCHKKQIDVQTEWGIFDDIFCVSNEYTYQFIEDVIAEITDLFPSQFIHIGGDEVPETQWENCSDCTNSLKKENLNNYEQLHGYFVRKVESILQKFNRTLIGWDEILEGGISEKSVVMSWRSVEQGVKAAEMNHQVIMTPTEYTYFDYYQAKEKQPKAIGGYLPLEKVFEFSPFKKIMNKEMQKLVLGGQANVWTEYIDSDSHLDYMIYPRLLAMAEKLYSLNSDQNYSDFVERVNSHTQILKTLNINYCNVNLESK